jgi:purine-binding chemotaxis protein CheW
LSVYVRLRVGGEQFALPVDSVREIARLGAIAPVPGAGDVLLGVRNLRGQVLPVFDLSALLGVAAGARPKRIVVAEQGGHRAGFAIDEVTDVAALPEPAPEPVAEFLSGTSLTDGEAVGVVDVVRLFAALQERASP